MTVALLFSLISAPAMAADTIKLSARAEPDRLPPGSAFRLIITVEGEGIRSLPEPELPRLKNFEIAGRSVSSQVSIVNFSVKVTKSVVYTVVAPKEGTFEIPPVTLEHQGRTYQTNRMTITVDPAAPAPSGPAVAGRRPGPPGGLFGDDPFFTGKRRLSKDDLMVAMEVDKREAAPLEQITATFSFYRAVDIWEKPGYQKPHFQGFWVEELPYEDGEMTESTVEKIRGITYHVTRARYALFPIGEGKKVVDQAFLSVSVDPWSQKVRLATDPIPITVKPFPDEGRPADFNGMVGKYEVSCDAAPVKVAVNDSVTLRLTISGRGYLKPAPPPGKPVVEGFEVFDPRVTDTIDKSGGAVFSKKTIEYPMIARKEGSFVVPPIKLSWRDPQAGAYARYETKPIKIDVTPAAFPLALASPVERHDAFQNAEKDIRYIKPDQSVLDDWGDPPYRGWLLWAVVILSFPALASAWVMAGKRERLATDTAYRRRVNAARIAMERLKEAQQNSGDPGDFFAGLDTALRGYLADRWNIPAPAVSKEIVEERMDGRNGLASSIIELLEAARRARYAPASGEDAQARLEKAMDIIQKMEQKR